MGTVSGKRQRRRLYHPAAMREDCQSDFFGAALEREVALGLFERRLLPRYDALLTWVCCGAEGQLREFQDGFSECDDEWVKEWATDVAPQLPYLHRWAAEYRAEEIAYTIAMARMFLENLVYETGGFSSQFNRPVTWRGDWHDATRQRSEPYVNPLRGEGVALGYALFTDIESFCRDTLRVSRDGQAPGWLHWLIMDELWEWCADKEIAEAETRVPGFIFFSEFDPAAPIRRGPLEIEWAISDDWDEFRKDAHARLDAILDEMRAEAEATYPQMNPSTEGRYRQDAEDLAALCVDDWQPIGEAHRKRLRRFAAFIGIDYPGQKLTRKAA